MRIISLCLCLLLIPASLAAAPVCATRTEATAALATLSDVMATGRFVAYQPTSLRVIKGELQQADEASIRADLKALRPWFDGLITYGAEKGAETIPDIAAELGFRAIIMGVWDPANQTEIANVLAAAKRQKKLVVGVSLGNEIIFGKRGSWADLQAAIATMQAKAPSLAITTTEPFAQFLLPESERTRAQMDFMAVNVHPIFEPWFARAPAFNWADFVVSVSAGLKRDFCGPILIKETGVPTGPQNLGYDEERQRAFYRELEKQMKPTSERAFAYFAAFDAPWRVDDVHPVPGQHPEEAHWGLFTESRKPKKVMDALPPLAPAR